MQIYHYDHEKLYAGKSLADESPLEAGVYLIPAQTTKIAPPQFGEHKVAIWDQTQWKIIDDYRETKYWLADGTEHEIKEAGIALPEGALLEPPLPPPLTREQIRDNLSAAVQSMLDEKVRERNYDNMIAVCSYLGSTNPKFAAEASACVAWRDAVWAACYDILDKVTQSAMPIPTEAELLAVLPKLKWPESVPA